MAAAPPAPAPPLSQWVDLTTYVLPQRSSFPLNNNIAKNGSHSTASYSAINPPPPHLSLSYSVTDSTLPDRLLQGLEAYLVNRADSLPAFPLSTVTASIEKFLEKARRFEFKNETESVAMFQRITDLLELLLESLMGVVDGAAGVVLTAKAPELAFSCSGDFDCTVTFVDDEDAQVMEGGKVSVELKKNAVLAFHGGVRGIGKPRRYTPGRMKNSRSILYKLANQMCQHGTEFGLIISQSLYFVVQIFHLPNNTGTAMATSPPLSIFSPPPLVTPISYPNPPLPSPFLGVLFALLVRNLPGFMVPPPPSVPPPPPTNSDASHSDGPHDDTSDDDDDDDDDADDDGTEGNDIEKEQGSDAKRGKGDQGGRKRGGGNGGGGKRGGGKRKGGKRGGSGTRKIGRSKATEESCLRTDGYEINGDSDRLPMSLSYLSPFISNEPRRLHPIRYSGPTSSPPSTPLATPSKSAPSSFVASPPSTPPKSLLQSPQILTVVLTEKIGEGRTSRVWRAANSGVVAKIVKMEFSEEIAQETAFYSNPPPFLKAHIPQYYGLYTLPGSTWVLMLLEDCGKWVGHDEFDSQEVQDFCREVRRALRKSGWKHDDIRAENITRTSAGLLKLIDFGNVERV